MFYLTKLSTAEIIQQPSQMTYVRVRSIGGMTPTGEKRKYGNKTLSQCRTDHKKTQRDWNELTVFAVHWGRRKWWWPLTSLKKTYQTFHCTFAQITLIRIITTQSRHCETECMCLNRWFGCEKSCTTTLTRYAVAFHSDLRDHFNELNVNCQVQGTNPPSHSVSLQRLRTNSKQKAIPWTLVH